MRYALRLIVPRGQVDRCLPRLRDVRVLIKNAGGASKLKKTGGVLDIELDADAEVLVQAVDMARRVEIDAVKAEVERDKRAKDWAEQNKKPDPADALRDLLGGGSLFK